MKLLSKLLILVCFLFIISPVKASAVAGIGLTPAIQEVELAEDQNSVTFEVEIINSTKATVDLRLSVLDFGALDESGGIAFIGKTGQETSVYGLSNWMKLEKDRITLKPQASQTVKVTVDNRDSLSPGGHYGAVVVSEANPGGTEPDSVSVVPAGSTLVLLKKNGGELKELKLDSINTNSSLINLPKSVNLRFQNSGNIHLVARGTVELFGPNGSLISRGVINQNSGYILPESFRQFDINFSNQNQPWLPGKYKLVTSWRYNEQDEMTVETKTYWYVGKLALWTMLILSLLIVFILFIKWRSRPFFRGQ